MTAVQSGARKALSLFILLLTLGLPSIVTAQITDINTAINKAGRERMLSQRMAKAYFQLGQDIDMHRSQRVLDSSIALFDRQLVELKNYSPTPEIRQTYVDLERVWITYKDLLVGTAPQVENGPAILELSDRVLTLAHQGTEQLEKLAGTTSGYLVNLSGRLRMLSQRMARDYQALAWGLGGNAAKELDKARTEFASALKELSEHADNTPAVNSRLDLVIQQWFFFDNALNERQPSDRTLEINVATTSERILEMMEEIVELYETLP